MFISRCLDFLWQLSLFRESINVYLFSHLQFKLFQLLFKKKDIVLLIINLSLYSAVNDFVLFTALKQIWKKKIAAVQSEFAAV